MEAFIPFILVSFILMCQASHRLLLAVMQLALLKRSQNGCRSPGEGSLSTKSSGWRTHLPVSSLPVAVSSHVNIFVGLARYVGVKYT